MSQHEETDQPEDKWRNSIFENSVELSDGLEEGRRRLKIGQWEAAVILAQYVLDTEPNNPDASSLWNDAIEEGDLWSREKAWLRWAVTFIGLLFWLEYLLGYLVFGGIISRYILEGWGLNTDSTGGVWILLGATVPSLIVFHVSFSRLPVVRSFFSFAA